MGFHEGLPAVTSTSHSHCNGNHKLYSVSSTSSSISKSTTTTTTSGDNVVFAATVEKPDRKSYLLNNHRSAGNSKQNRKDAIKDSLAAILASTKLDDDEDEGSEDFLLAITKGKKNNNKTAVRKSHSSELLEMGQKAARIHNKHLIRQRNAEFTFFKSPAGRNNSDDGTKKTTLRRVKSGGGILAAMQSTLTGGGGVHQQQNTKPPTKQASQQQQQQGEKNISRSKSSGDRLSIPPNTRRHSGGVLSSMQNALFHVGEKQRTLNSNNTTKNNSSNKVRASAALDDPFIDYLLNSCQQSPGALKNNGAGGVSNKEDKKSPGKFKMTLPNPLAIPGGIGLPTSNPLNIMRAPLTRSNSDGALKKARNIQTYSERHEYGGDGGGVDNPKASVRRTASTVSSGSTRASLGLSRDASCPKSASIDTGEREHDYDNDIRFDDVTSAVNKNEYDVKAFSSPHQTAQRPSLKDYVTVTGNSWLGLEAEMPLVDHSVPDSYHYYDSQEGSPTSIRNNTRRSSRGSRSPCRSSPRGERPSSSSPTLQDAKLVKRDSWLVLETEIPLIDHSSYDDEVPGEYHEDASSSKSLRATKPRHSQSSHIPKKNSSSSSCDGGGVMLRDDPSYGGVFSPLDDDDWCGADLEAAIMGAGNSSSPHSTTTKSHRRGRSLSDTAAADPSSTNNPRGKRSSRKSRSPGKYEDRITRCRSSSKHGGTGHNSRSPGKCKERKVITTHGASSSSSSQQQHSGVLYNEFISISDASLKGTPEDLFLLSSSPTSSSSFLPGTSSYCNMMMMDSSSIRSMTTRNNNNNNNP